jgi:hypothetical protein
MRHDQEVPSGRDRDAVRRSAQVRHLRHTPWELIVAAVALVVMPRDAAASSPPAADFALLGQLGGYSIRGHAKGEGQAGVGIVASPLYRTDLLVIGGSIDLGGGFGGSTTSACGIVGGSLGAASGWRVDLLAVGGARYYVWGQGFLSDDPGMHATLPYAGGRLQGMYLFGRSRRSHVALGAMLGVDTDLWTVRRQYSYVETPWLDWDGSGGSYTATADHTAGGRRVWVGITVGWVRDIW